MAEETQVMEAGTHTANTVPLHAEDSSNAHESEKPRHPRWLHRIRTKMRAHPLLFHIYRVGVAIIGGIIVLAGVIMIPAPGPGWLVVFAGLGILSTEFHWAHRLLAYAKKRVRAATQRAKSAMTKKSKRK